ncbi:MAG: hypothetical protein JSV50_17615 [Desulfobacteraceae bacterium]|nr:MAG: hypothetical protein JSV50_17615 [Desulfobacteraceae bacterium]
MVTIPPYHPILIDNTSQVGIAQQQEKQNEEKKVTVQNSHESDKLRFEREKKEGERPKKRRKAQQQKDQLQEDEDLGTRKKRLLDVIV